MLDCFKLFSLIHLSVSQKNGLLLAGEKGFGESDIGSVKHRSRDHITSTLQLKSESHTGTAMDIGLNCIVDNLPSVL